MAQKELTEDERMRLRMRRLLSTMPASAGVQFKTIRSRMTTVGADEVPAWSDLLDDLHDAIAAARGAMATLTAEHDCYEELRRDVAAMRRVLGIS